MDLRFLSAGDAAVVAELGDGIDPGINRRVHDLAHAVEAHRLAGVVDLVPTYRSLLVDYDPLRTTLGLLERQIADLAAHLQEQPRRPRRVLEVPTVYGGQYGPDLAFVAEHAGLAADEVIRIHSEADYLIYMMGFTAGFPYLGGMSAKIATPRLQTPRTRIPAGSVGIAQQQTGIYPAEGPGGWQLIGRTPLRLFDPRRDPPVAVEAGEYIRFVAITEGTFRDIERGVREGTYTPTVRSQE